LTWEVDGGVITGPETFARLDLGHGFAKWAQESLSPDEAEAALVLRRCVVISVGRTIDLDAQLTAVPRGRCYSEQPRRAPRARRVRGSTQDFSDRAERLCEADQEWIEFRA
jgi:hypothetical protein